jgi:segregation and condensation protein B
MSLKAKLEAVIYAAEEPVTLAQLAALFAADALEWKAEQEAAAAEVAEEAAHSTTHAQEPLPLMAEGLEYLGLEQTPDVYTSPETEAAMNERLAEPEAAETAMPAAQGEPNAEISEAAQIGETPADAEAEARRLARQRDRDVKAVLRQLIDELIASNATDDRGVEIREIAGGYRMATKPECHDAVRMFIKSLKPAMKLSLPALETLAVIAYKQPVTAPEVNEIRGVDSSGVFGSLLARKLITTAGRKPVIGRPILYKTTREFLLRFGLKDVAELPSMEEFEKMAAMELDEAAAEAEAEANIGGPESPDAGPEVDTEPDEDVPESEAGGNTTSAAEPPEAEAAPGEPSPTQQAETETPPHD